MKVLNIHKRIIDEPKQEIVELIKTLSTEHDMVWPKEKWPAMKFNDGIKVGANGGHGPVKYTVVHYDPARKIEFQFSKPEGFNGIHKFEIKELTKETTEIIHTIDMNTVGIGTLTWILAIRSLHNALIEDAFDKIENTFATSVRSSPWNFWVRCLRAIIAKRK